jgi:hypothetical protein
MDPSLCGVCVFWCVCVLAFLERQLGSQVGLRGVFCPSKQESYIGLR